MFTKVDYGMLLFLTIMFLFTIIEAQNNNISKETLVNFEKGIEKYQEYTRTKKEKTLINAINYFKKVVKITSKKEDVNKNFLARSYTNLGWCMICLEKFEEAKQYCAKAYDLDSKDLGVILNLGNSYFLIGEDRKAKKLYRQVIDASKNIEELEKNLIGDLFFFMEKGWKINSCQTYLDWIREVADRKNIESTYSKDSSVGLWDSVSENYRMLKLSWDGAFHYSKNEYVAGINKFSEALDIANKLKDRSAIATIHNNLGQGYVYLDDHVKGKEHFNEALKIYFLIEDKVNFANSHDNIGAMYYMEGQYDLALKHLKISLEKFTSIDEKEGVTKSLNRISMIHMQKDNYDLALCCAKKSLDIDKSINSKVGIARDYGNIGFLFYCKNKYGSAIEYYEKSLSILRELDDQLSIAHIFNNLAVTHRKVGNYKKAIKYLEESLKIHKSFGWESKIAKDLNDVSTIYDSWGKYEKALDYLHKALNIQIKLKLRPDIAGTLKNIANVYKSWGQYDRAIDYCNRALAIDLELDRKGQITLNLNNMANIYQLQGEHYKALDYYDKALKISREVDNKSNVADILGNKGSVYYFLEIYDEALNFYKQALSLDKQLGKKVEIAVGLSNIGDVHKALGEYEEAIGYFEKALKILEHAEEKTFVALILNNLGFTYYQLEKYDVAINYFNKSAKITQSLRFEAPGDIKLDYFSSVIDTYQALNSCYFRTNELHKMYKNTSENKAKLLFERLNVLSTPDLKTFQKNISSQTSVFMYSNSNRKMMINICIGKNDIEAVEVNPDHLINTLPKNLKNKILRNRVLSNNLFSKIKQKSDSELYSLVLFYHKLLGQPLNTSKKHKQFEQTSRLLYEILIKPFENKLKLKKDLIIIPDGILGLIPFETLIDENNKYLVEKYNISYIQSPTILDVLKLRKYPEDRKSLLAFGGGEYNNYRYDGDVIKNDRELVYLKREFHEHKDNKETSFRYFYEQLGLSSWENFSKIDEEIKKIRLVFPDLLAFVSSDSSESNIKALSSNLTLKKYKILHFSTHGFVEVSIPELSGLVLSQFVEQKNGEDGYLRLEEIANLNLNADFVMLAACETGLGKVYLGEGVVNLAEAFMRAGANGIAVSLWKVDTDARTIFARRLYELVAKGTGYSEAINKVKREFINNKFFKYNKNYAQPYYWSTFVYYGK